MDNNYPLVNYNFLLRVESKYDLPCKSVQGLKNQKEFEYIHEGGVNDYVHIRRKPAQNPNTFQVERYVLNESDNPLTVGAVFELPIQLFVARYPGEFSQPMRTYSFTGCVVVSKEYGQLSAEQSGILTESITIAYEEMTCSDNNNEKLKAVWKFDKNKTEGNNVRNAVKPQDLGVRKWPDVNSNVKDYL